MLLKNYALILIFSFSSLYCCFDQELSDSDGASSYSYEAHLVGLFTTDAEIPVENAVIYSTLNMALEEANRKFPKIKFQLSTKLGNGTCLRNNGGAVAAQMYYTSKKSVSALMGPACSASLNSVGRMASYWNLPILTAGGIEDVFANKKVFSTLTRLSFSLDSISRFLITILKNSEWHHISVIVDDSEPLMVLFKNAFQNMIKAIQRTDNYEFKIEYFYFNNKNSRRSEIEYALRQANKYARVFLLLSTPNTVRKILLEAYELQMHTGEYAFIGVEMIRNKKVYGEFNWFKQGDYRNREAKRMFESLMLITVRVPVSSEYVSFQHDVIKRANREFNSTFTVDEINPTIAAFYDAIILYGFALNKTIESGEDPHNAKNLLKRLWNKTYFGLTGDIYINENGDRESDYTVNDLDVESGQMQPVATYYGTKKIYEKLEGMEIQWPGRDSPPLDVPYCGFLGDAAHCLPEEGFPIIKTILFFLLAVIVIGTIAGYFVYKHMRMEASLADCWWRINYDELEFMDEKGQAGRKSTLSLASETSFMSKTTVSTVRPHTTTITDTGVSLNTTTLANLGIRIANYKNVRVAVKMLDIKKLHINRALLMELKQMREQMHENLIKIIGVCIEAPNYCIVSELCPRGTLSDLLQNEKLNIDWVFKYSIITDVVEGLYFIHSSVLNHHGRLKSNNCVVDSRFVVKITDYDMREIHSQIEDKVYHRKNERTGDVDEAQEDFNLRELFWTAPEHLREKQPEKTIGSKKGDIYSLGIILQEVITRSGPYEIAERVGRKKESLNPEQIIDKIKMALIPPYRPEVASDEAPIELIELMNDCWQESPNARPDIGPVKSKLKKITRGISSKNFFDNLLSRMEQYANNLEQLVEEKTNALIEEKQKADEILYQLLPKTVADQLKVGIETKPEAFSSVTIFFSDIVGFTVLSSMSTPMQVVDFLNDLYTCFDAIIEKHDVYKVETIGDAYLVASGCPNRNGNEHSREIARMALELRDATQSFVVKHRPEHKLQIRIGIHSGPCVGGVIGFKMPRYFVFGETVNIANKMETNGEPLRIHITEVTKKLLDTFFTFKCELRGNVDLKGIGSVIAYWLINEQKLD